MAYYGFGGWGGGYSRMPRMGGYGGGFGGYSRMPQMGGYGGYGGGYPQMGGWGGGFRGYSPMPQMGGYGGGYPQMGGYGGYMNSLQGQLQSLYNQRIANDPRQGMANWQPSNASAQYNLGTGSLQDQLTALRQQQVDPRQGRTPEWGGIQQSPYAQAGRDAYSRYGTDAYSQYGQQQQQAAANMYNQGQMQKPQQASNPRQGRTPEWGGTQQSPQMRVGGDAYSRYGTDAYSQYGQQQQNMALGFGNQQLQAVNRFNAAQRR